MSYQFLLVSQNEHIATVTINRPDQLNALNSIVLNELEHFFSNIPDQTRAIILTGSGEKAFVAGADIKELAKLSSEEAYEAAKKGQRIFQKIEDSSVPVIAAVNGFALGGGCELAIACHLRVISDKAQFAQPEINLGLMAGYGGTQRLTKLIGTTKATELLLTGDMIQAKDALALGLANALVAPDHLMDEAEKLARKIASKPPIQASLTLKAIQGYHDKEIEGFDQEAKLFAKTVTTEDFREGTSAFVEKRKPSFKGK